jgi:hypothetical protein
MPKHVVLPDEREAQLRAIAATHNVTVAESVGLLVGWAIEQGKVEAGIPGIEIHRNGDTVEIDFGTFRRVYTVELARAFAVALRWFARPKGTQFSDILEALSGAEVIGLSRRGTSIKIAGDEGDERTLAPSIARELADLIERSAA